MTSTNINSERNELKGPIIQAANQVLGRRTKNTITLVYGVATETWTGAIGGLFFNTVMNLRVT
jgi:hypothetical protein